LLLVTEFQWGRMSVWCGTAVTTKWSSIPRAGCNAPFGPTANLFDESASGTAAPSFLECSLLPTQPIRSRMPNFRTCVCSTYHAPQVIKCRQSLCRAPEHQSYRIRAPPPPRILLRPSEKLLVSCSHGVGCKCHQQSRCAIRVALPAVQAEGPYLTCRLPQPSSVSVVQHGPSLYRSTHRARGHNHTLQGVFSTWTWCTCCCWT